MKNQSLYLLLVLSLLLGQNSVATANSGDPMNVKTTTSATATLSDKTEKPKEAKEEKVEVKKEEPKKTEAPKPKEKKIVTHTVKQGESLWRIAQQYLDNGNRWRELIDLNKEAYPSIEKNPNLIYTGWQIKVALDDKEETNASEIGNATTGNTGTEDGSSNKTDSKDKSGEEVKVTDSSKDSSAVNQSKIPNWTTKEKIRRLQECLDRANRALLAQKKRIADLNTQTVKFMVNNGFMKQEDWMAMNPPIGYTYRINQNGKVELVNAKNVALTDAEIATLDSKLASAPANRSVNSATGASSGKKEPNGGSNGKAQGGVDRVEIRGRESDLGKSIGELMKTIRDAGKEIGDAAKELGKEIKKTGKEIEKESKKATSEIEEAFKETGREFEKAGKEMERDTKKLVKDLGEATKDISYGFKEAGEDLFGRGADNAEEDFRAKQEAYDAWSSRNRD